MSRRASLADLSSPRPSRSWRPRRQPVRGAHAFPWLPSCSAADPLPRPAGPQGPTADRPLVDLDPVQLIASGRQILRLAPTLALVPLSTSSDTSRQKRRPRAPSRRGQPRSALALDPSHAGSCRPRRLNRPFSCASIRTACAPSSAARIDLGIGRTARPHQPVPHRGLPLLLRRHGGPDPRPRLHRLGLLRPVRAHDVSRRPSLRSCRRRCERASRPTRSLPSGAGAAHSRAFITAVHGTDSMPRLLARREQLHQDRQDPNALSRVFLSGATAGALCALLETPVRRPRLPLCAISSRSS